VGVKNKCLICLSDCCCCCKLSRDHVLATAALPPIHHHSLSLSPSSYQQNASVKAASGDRDSRSPRSKFDRREVVPHLCDPATRQSPPCPIHHLRRINHQSSQVHAGPSQGRGLPLLSSPRSDVSPYPSCPYEFEPQHLALPSSCVRQQASTRTRMMEADACMVFSSASHHSRQELAVVLEWIVSSYSCCSDGPSLLHQKFRCQPCDLMATTI